VASRGEKGKCFSCGAELKPVFPEHVDPDAIKRDDFTQYDNALPITFDGGYGMFHDDMDAGCRYEVVICHECAHKLCKVAPWVGALIDPATSHSHTEEYSKKHPNHFGWDYERREGT
jgi:hypothetical protein